ncbi:MAG: hypothetical protein E7159_00520 [Firmicutes bacterium]|nr:hypothetical protein [Bacillota bacterium]
MKKYIMGLLLFIGLICFTVNVKAEENTDREVIEYVEEYIVTDTYYDKNGTVLYNEDRKVSKAEAEFVAYQREKLDLQNIASINSNIGWDVIHETNSKMIGLTYYKFRGENYYTYVEVRVHWYTVPNVKQYDVIGVRWDGNATLVDATGVQNASGDAKQSYSFRGDNMVIKSNGVGITMNLFDNKKDFQLKMDVQLVPSSVSRVYASYQHCTTNNINLSQSKSYNFSNNGLGNVIDFTSSSIRNKYDGMAGVSTSNLSVLNR